jgi:hypothetical protein
MERRDAVTPKPIRQALNGTRRMGEIRKLLRRLILAGGK